MTQPLPEQVTHGTEGDPPLPLHMPQRLGLGPNEILLPLFPMSPQILLVIRHIGLEITDFPQFLMLVG